MPLGEPEQFGTGADGARVDDYCHFCMKDGEFTEPDITMQEMTAKVTSMLVKHAAMPEAEAAELLRQTIPTLKRWRQE